MVIVTTEQKFWTFYLCVVHTKSLRLSFLKQLCQSVHIGSYVIFTNGRSRSRKSSNLHNQLSLREITCPSENGIETDPRCATTARRDPGAAAAVKRPARRDGVTSSPVNMSGDRALSRLVSPAECNEKPWDLWVGEIGRCSPGREDGAAGRHKVERGARRARVNRLRLDTASLHGMFPQMDELNAAVCHLCGAAVKCSAAYRHLLEAHAEPDLPPPPAPPAPVTKTKRSRRELPPPAPPDPPPPPVMHDLPVVSIQDADDLPLGDNLTDDIFAIMNSEGIQSADDIASAADWKNIIRDIGNMQDINFPPGDDGQSAREYPGSDPVALAALAAYEASERDELALPETVVAPEPAVPPPAAAPPPAGRARSRSRSGKSRQHTRHSAREYDPNRHCGVPTADNMRPCTRSLTCKAHALSLRRTVEGRAKPFDTLLAEHRAARDQSTPATLPPPPPAPVLSPEPPVAPSPSPSPSPEPLAPSPTPSIETQPELFLESDVCWYTSCPRPLAVCTFNASHAGGVATLGKRFARVRGDVKSALSRAGGGIGPASCTAGAGRSRQAGGRSARPELRRLVVAAGWPQWVPINGHVDRRRSRSMKRPSTLDLPYTLDPLLADDKC